MRKALSLLLWGGISALGALGLGLIALHHGETINAAWLVVAAVCTYAVGYRFYSKFLAYRVFGHHFAAIAGAGPLVGPVLAASIREWVLVLQRREPAVVAETPFVASAY